MVGLGALVYPPFLRAHNEEVLAVLIEVEAAPSGQAPQRGVVIVQVRVRNVTAQLQLHHVLQGSNVTQ